MNKLAMLLSCPFTAFGSMLLPRSRHQIVEAFASYFSVTEFPHYGAFLNAAGSPLKRERRTLVTIIQRPRQDSPLDEVSTFVLKVYKYPFWPRIRTGFQISKAEREFESLRYLNGLGIGAAQAVGYGVERSPFGLVRSCFIITRFVDDSINLSQWYSELERQKNPDLKKVEQVFTELGRIFRRLHQAHFFLFTAKSKNILLRHGPDIADELFLIDIPYARTLQWRLLARWARARDIGVLFSNVSASLSGTVIELFYRAYLPDPLGLPSKTVRRHALGQMRAKQNRTPISRCVHEIKRRLVVKTNRLVGFLIFAELIYG